MTTFHLHSFVSEYQGPKLRMLFTGVGSYATGLLGVPGASKVLDSIQVPYSHEACSLLFKRHYPQGLEVSETHGSVSKEMAVALHACNSADLGDLIPITVTAAITTSRYRRGDNQAFIAVGKPDNLEVWHLRLDKLTEEEHQPEAVLTKRYFQDRLVSEVAICLATSLTTPILTDLLEGGHLVRV